MGGVTLQHRLKQKDVSIGKSLFYIYPPMEYGLDIECGSGERILTARKCGTRIFGISTDDFSKDWKAYNIDLMCKQASPLDIPYRDNSFDYVLTNNGLLSTYSKEEIETALKEIYRISSDKYFLKLRLNAELTPDWYLKILRGIGYWIEVWRGSHQGTLIVEACKECWKR